MAKTVYEILVELEGNKDAQKGLERLGDAAGVTGVALTALSAAAGKLAADYDFSLNKVATLATEATGSIQELDAAFFELSNQMNGSINVNEAAAASYDILSSGYTEQADILGLLRVSQEAAIGGYSDLGTVSDAVTTIINSFGDALGENLTVTEKARKVTDLLIQTQNDGKTTVDALGQSYGQIAATAASAGVEFEVLNAIISNSTAQGLQTSEAITGLKQVIAGIQKPTSEAVAEAERLGISFDATALKTKGLDGVLLEIANSTKLADDSIAKLFGSTEAQTIVNQQLVEGGAQLIQFLDNQRNAVGTTAEAYEQMSESISVRATNAFNQLQNTMVRLGQGVLIAVEPAIDALNFLVENFQKLPVPLQQAVGLATILGGTSLIAAKGILSLAANISDTIKEGKAAIQVIGQLGSKLGGLTKAASGTSAITSLAKLPTTAGAGLQSIALGVKSVGASAAAAAPLLLALVGAIGAVTLAWKQYDNIQKQIKFEEQSNALKATEPLVAAAEKAVQKIRETGKALPKEEYEALISTLEGANDEYDSLGSIIRAVERVQAEAAATTEQATAATQAGADANQEAMATEEELAAAQEEKARAFEEYVNKQKEYQQQLSTQMRIELDNIELSKTSEVEAVQAKLNAQRRYYNEILQSQQNLLSQSQLTGEQRKQIELEVQQTLTSIAQAEAEARRALVDLQIAEVEQRLAVAQSEAEALQAVAQVQSDVSQANLSYVSSIKGLYGEILQLTKDENSSLAFKNELFQIGVGLQEGLAALGIETAAFTQETMDAEMSMQQMMNELALIEIQLKLEQLKIEQQIIALEADARRAEIEGQMEIARIRRDNATTDEERRAAQATLDMEQRKLEVLEKQTQAKLRANELSQQITQFEGQLQQAKNNEFTRDAASPSGQYGQPVETESDKKTAAATEKTAQAIERNTSATESVAQSAASQADAQQQIVNVSEQGNASLKTIANYSKGLLDNTRLIVGQLQRIQTQLNNLPTLIGRSIPVPRPSPPSRD